MHHTPITAAAAFDGDRCPIARSHAHHGAICPVTNWPSWPMHDSRVGFVLLRLYTAIQFPLPSPPKPDTLAIPLMEDA